jgi:hypothetical protein
MTGSANRKNTSVIRLRFSQHIAFSYYQRERTGGNQGRLTEFTSKRAGTKDKSGKAKAARTNTRLQQKKRKGDEPPNHTKRREGNENLCFYFVPFSVIWWFILFLSFDCHLI